MITKKREIVRTRLLLRFSCRLCLNALSVHSSSVLGEDTAVQLLVVVVAAFAAAMYYVDVLLLLGQPVPLVSPLLLI